jgi:hypothetical protein
MSPLPLKRRNWPSPLPAANTTSGVFASTKPITPK